MTDHAPKPSVRGKRRLRVIITVCAAAFGSVLVAVVVAALTGILPSADRDSTYPPCDELPSSSEVQEALTLNASLVEELKSQGKDVQIAVATPCASDPNSALIEVRYTESASRRALDAVLTKADGFGVPLYVTKR